MEIKFRLNHSGARLPERKHSRDIALDVFTPEEGTLKPGANKIDLGFSMEVPDGWLVMIIPRSGMASGGWDGHTAISAEIPPVDPGYTGNVHAIVTNHSDRYFDYEKGTRFGQMVCCPAAYIVPVLYQESDRGDRGFGSSGVAG